MTEEYRGKILIVDDNISNLQLLVSMLSKYRYEISVARSGAEAVRIAPISIPDLILLDIMMPEMDGFLVCEQIKENPNTCNIPIIFLSALDDVDNKMKGFSIGGVDYITKPFHEEEVIARVKTHISLEITKKELQSAVHNLTREHAARKKSEEHLQTILHSLPQQVTYLDADLRMQYINKPTEMFTGKSSDELIGKHIAEIIPEKDYSRIESYFKKGLAGAFIQEETWGIHPDGSSAVLDVQIIPDISIDGVILGLFVVLTDISLHRQNELAIRNLQQQMEIVLNSIQAVIYVSDLNSHEVLYANKECINNFGDIVGKPCYTVLQKDQIGPCPFCTNEKLVDAKGNPTGVIQWEMENLRNGKWYLCQDIAIPWIDGRIVRMEIATDLTEKRMQEIALKRSNHKLNLLSSITRHDVLNMLTAMLGYYDIIDDLEISPDVREFLNKQKSAALLLEHMINFTRDYQNIGYKNPDWQDVGVILEELMKQFDSEQITIRNELQGLIIYADPLLERVFYNLIENALRHGKHVKTISFSYMKRGDAVCMVVADDGIGIPPDKKEKIFKREYFHNSGIGLFVTRDVLDITGITITETGTYGNGTQFEILIPKGGYKFSRPIVS